MYSCAFLLKLRSSMPLQILYQGDSLRAIQRALFVSTRHLVKPETVIVGIRTGGDVLAERFAHFLAAEHQLNLPVGYVDISLYRDDFAHRSHWPHVQGSSVPVPIEGRPVLLMDEVLFTGRTVRAAIEAINDMGRAASIRLAVLFDRGDRELPIQPDACGAVVPLPRQASLLVEFGADPAHDRAISVQPDSPTVAV